MHLRIAIVIWGIGCGVRKVILDLYNRRTHFILVPEPAPPDEKMLEKEVGLHMHVAVLCIACFRNNIHVLIIFSSYYCCFISPLVFRDSVEGYVESYVEGRGGVRWFRC